MKKLLENILGTKADTYTKQDLVFLSAGFYKCSCSHFDHRDSNAAFNISANGWFLYEQTVGQSASIVRPIGGPLNQSSEKVVQLESSGGSR